MKFLLVPVAMIACGYVGGIVGMAAGMANAQDPMDGLFWMLGGVVIGATAGATLTAWGIS